jgi:hypothetical protein
MKLTRATGLAAAFALVAGGCGQQASPRQATRSDSGADVANVSDGSGDLPDLVEALVPPEAIERPTQDELTVEECGIQPVYPCVRIYFVTEDIDLEDRLALVRRQARSAGWRIVGERRDHGVIVEIARGRYSGTYMLEGDDLLLCENAPRCISGTMLTLAGPPTPLPAPSASERRDWSAEKKSFVAAANDVCAHMQARMTSTDEIASALADGLRELSALDAPRGEDGDVARVLRPLRNLVHAAVALTDDEGDDALPAAVGVGEFAKRFNEAASRYGLDACATLA